jgi:hypothetical protein
MKFNGIKLAIEHHLGLSFIVVAFVSLFYQKFVNDKKVHLPGHFFLIYAIGCFFLSYSMWNQNAHVFIVFLECIIGVLGLYFYFYQ